MDYILDFGWISDFIALQTLSIGGVGINKIKHVPLVAGRHPLVRTVLHSHEANIFQLAYSLLLATNIGDPRKSYRPPQ